MVLVLIRAVPIWLTPAPVSTVLFVFEAPKDRLGGVQEARRRERCQVDVIDDYHWMAGANLYVPRWRLYGSDSDGASSDHRDPRN